ncbi:hypothetical protein [Magnetospirillum aberrantis]|uniref:Uncharacterized protein n=1 Tax=Magnetospirillum aberrantis SpK TaxID=908842 RepID=A0A7C9UXE5_9PROT|nr:hypothetical protein [Magnetospirillum aberrantis]NFV78993.1 hypothetical protein [Magnetospirillum aberrantis SpK]
MLDQARECYIRSGRAEGYATLEERAAKILADRPAVRRVDLAVGSAEASLFQACQAVDLHRDREPTGVTAKFTGRHSRWEATLQDLEAKVGEAEEAVGTAKEALKAAEDKFRPDAECEARRNAEANATGRRHAADWRRVGDAFASGDIVFAAKIQSLLGPDRNIEHAVKVIRPDKLREAVKEWTPPVAKANPETLKALATLDMEAPARKFGR